MKKRDRAVSSAHYYYSRRVLTANLRWQNFLGQLNWAFEHKRNGSLTKSTFYKMNLISESASFLSPLTSGHPPALSSSSMTMNISRTPAPETWLSPHSLGSTARKALDTRAIVVSDQIDPHIFNLYLLNLQLEKSRFSVSTINSDLFPELLSWSAIMDVQPTSPCLQKVPLDVSKRDTVLTTTSSLSVILDPTTLEFGFDESCFDGLDDLLVYSPMDAFSEFCWGNAIHEHDSDHASSPTPSPIKSDGRIQNVRSPLVNSPFSDESDTDSDECLTFMEDDKTHSPIIGKDVKSVGEFPSYVSYIYPFFCLLANAIAKFSRKR